MPIKKYIIGLSDQERAALEKLAASNHHSVREKTRARILLRSDHQRAREAGGSQKDAEIAAALQVDTLTVARVRQRAWERGAVASVKREAQSNRKARKLDGAQEAHLVAVVCSSPPAGAARWSLKLIRERLIEMEVVEHIGLETIRTTLKKMHLNPG